MCGIVGIASCTPSTSPERLLAMRDTLAHRGPDDSGCWWSNDRRIGLGHRRLAIVDLSPAGRQPMEDAGGRLRITFNGEIYNFQELASDLRARGHVFRSGTDTEVVIEAYRRWGIECLERLVGMFAFALYDADARVVFLARDRAGEKPLFYREAEGTLTFASEIKALMADPSLQRTVDPVALDHYLAYGYAPPERCLLNGVRKLPGGHAMTWSLERGETRVWRWWHPPEPMMTNVADEGELVDELERLLLDAVRQQLVADVPVGILLSGGIDSSLVTALAARVASEPVRTFTISFPGAGRFNEAPFARTVANAFGTRHTELAAEDGMLDLLPALVRQMDEPIADSSIMPTYLVSRLIRPHATVALGGDGGDELFGGYRHYGWLQTMERWRRHVPRALRSLGSAARYLPVGTKGRTYLLGFRGHAADSIAHVDMYFDAPARRRLLSADVRRCIAGHPAAEKAKLDLCTAGRSIVQQATTVDFSTYLVGDILTKVDRASMLTGLEVRAPWLDHRIVEFAFYRVPDHLRATEHERKILPRRLARRLLPPQLDLDRKQGFSIPLDAWMRGQLGRTVEEALNEADPRMFDRTALTGLARGARCGINNGKRLFALAMLELWRREYQVAAPS